MMVVMAVAAVVTIFDSEITTVEMEEKEFQVKIENLQKLE